MHAKLTGEANDYVGKGMAGGEIVIVNPPDINYRPEDSSLVGNTCLYGATGGRLFVNGRAGEVPPKELAAGSVSTMPIFAAAAPIVDAILAAWDSSSCSNVDPGMHSQNKAAFQNCGLQLHYSSG